MIQGDITGTPDCVIDTDDDCSTVDPDDVTVVEDTVTFEDSTVDQSGATERHVDELCLEVTSVQELAHMAGTQLSFTVRSHVVDDSCESTPFIHIQDLGTVSNMYVELVGISHITQVRSLLELPADSSLQMWIRDCDIGVWDYVDWRSLSPIGSSNRSGALMDLISSLPGVVLIHVSSLSDAGISFYTPMLGVVCISSRPLRMQWACDESGTSEMLVFTGESQDRVATTDIQEDAMDNSEDLVSSPVSFSTEELDSDATVFDTPYDDVSFGVDLQSMHGSTPEISDFEDTPLDSVVEEDCRRQSSQRHHVSS